MEELKICELGVHEGKIYNVEPTRQKRLKIETLPLWSVDMEVKDIDIS